MVKAIKLSPFFYHDATTESYPSMFAGYKSSKDKLRYVCPETQRTYDYSEHDVGFREFLSRFVSADQIEEHLEIQKYDHKNWKTIDEIVGVDEITNASPERFYSGYAPTWADLQQDLDIRRSIMYKDQLIEYKSFINLLTQSNAILQTFVVFGEAGSGKTTFLRLIAYDMFSCGNNVIRNYFGAIIDTTEVIEYVKRNQSRRLFIVLDDAQYFPANISTFTEELAGFNVCIICGARKNEWNEETDIQKAKLYPEEIYLAPLNLLEVSSLLEKLEKQHHLGSLTDLSTEDRVRFFMEKADKQLLIGMLELTRGKRFREIVYDEFRSIRNKRAQFLYLAICYSERLRLSLTNDLAEMISGASSQWDLSHEIYSSLELVVKRVRTQRGIVWLPRHWLIGNELLNYYCKEAEDLLSVGTDILDKLSLLKSENYNVQNYAAYLVKQINHKSLINTTEESQQIIGLLLKVGWQNIDAKFQGLYKAELKSSAWYKIGDYNFPYSSYMEFHVHPIQAQFRVAVEVAKKHLGVEEALKLALLGLRINPRWYHLKLDQAIIEAGRGNIDVANLLVREILDSLKSDKYNQKITIPLLFAIDLAKFMQQKQPHDAIEYLLLADYPIYDGMEDTHGYFDLLTTLYSSINDIDNYRHTLEVALRVLSGPERTIRALEARYIALLYSRDEDAFNSWKNKSLSENSQIPVHILEVLWQAAFKNPKPEFLLFLASQSSSIPKIIARLQKVAKYVDDDRRDIILRVVSLLENQIQDHE